MAVIKQYSRSLKMSKKITDRVKFSLNKHHDADSAKKELEEGTFERKNFFLEKMDWMESSLDKGNHEAYRIAFNQLKAAIDNQKNTLDKLHDIILFDDK